ncbi:MAG: M1 family metallopeptidase [Bacteroidia bacterium]|nr:M1 family metallopeptidase [Bacteroidia bacterium]
MKRLSAIFLILAWVTSAFAQEVPNTNQNKFRQMGQDLPTPNSYRTASGAPGNEYWQNEADYVMDIALDDAKQTISGTETITYHNYSPDRLSYLWVQLDQNMRAKDSDSYKIRTGEMNSRMSFGGYNRMENNFDGGFKLEYVQDINGKPLKHVVNKTMMRIDLPQALESGASVSFKIKWWYNINDRMKIGGRSGMEYFEEDDNYLYTIAQFFPRMCVYNEVEGWQNKQFLGRGEFTLPFGDYKVKLTVPADHVVGATGVLQNPKSVMNSAERSRWKKAQSSDEPIIIVTEEEAREKEKSKVLDKTKTWEFHAENVRDFAFCSSRKFIWDAMSVKFGDRNVMAMSYYPKEGNPLWEKYSTRVVAHTLKTYSKFTFDYPYPAAISVHAARIGMEYPMICFNFGRPEKDGTYSERTKYGMIGVIIHEVGHNFFPMIVNSDERQWTWMDEGLNTFLQYLTEQEWERDYPSRRGPAYKITDYMKGDKRFISPIMTNSESIYQFGNNAYAKPATALNILRETVLGRELFDYAFKEYSQRWKFKHPSPADFFRTMEDASAVDLDWFWRGWFYTNDHVDISLDEVQWFQLDTKNPDIEKPIAKSGAENRFIGDTRNKEDIKETVTERLPNMNDFYNEYDPYEVTILDRQEYERYMAGLSDEEKKVLESGQNFYQLKFSNKGGLVTPVIMEFTYTDGTTEVIRIPAELWKLNSGGVTKVFKTEKEIASIELDPFLETADTDLSNNHWPPKPQPTRFELFKQRQRRGGQNPMQRDRMIKKMEDEKSKSGKK